MISELRWLRVIIVVLVGLAKQNWGYLFKFSFFIIYSVLIFYSVKVIRFIYLFVLVLLIFFV